MFPNVLVPTPLHNYSRQLFTAKGPQHGHGAFFTSSSAFLMENLLNERRCSPPAAHDGSPAYPLDASPDYESCGSPCAADYRVRKTDGSPDGDGSPDHELEQSGDSGRLRIRLDQDHDSRTDHPVEPDDRWTPKRDYESVSPQSQRVLQQESRDQQAQQPQQPQQPQPPRKSASPDLMTCVVPAFTSDAAFRHFYHNEVFKTYPEAVFRQDSYIDHKTRLCELYTDYKQNVVVVKPGGKRAQDCQTEKETPVLKFSVNAILGTEPGKNQPLPSPFFQAAQFTSQYNLESRIAKPIPRPSAGFTTLQHPLLHCRQPYLSVAAHGSLGVQGATVFPLPGTFPWAHSSRGHDAPSSLQ